MEIIFIQLKIKQGYVLHSFCSVGSTKKLATVTVAWVSRFIIIIIIVIIASILRNAAEAQQCC